MRRIASRRSGEHEQTESSRKRLEFAQRLAWLIAIFSCGIVFVTITYNFLLLWAGKEAMTDVTIQTVATYGTIVTVGATVIYAVLTGFRTDSLNKNVLKAKIQRGESVGDVAGQNMDEESNNL